MMINIDGLPTPLAQVANRLNIVGPNDSADTFLVASYLSEAAIKLTALSFYSALQTQNSQHAYKIGYDLVRADGLGSWTAAVERATSMPYSSFLPPEFSTALEWVTRRRTRPEDEWFREALKASYEILGEMGIEVQQTRKESIRNLLTALVQIRNKTKAHGALGSDFFSFANPKYTRALELFIANCPIFSWTWLHISKRDKKVATRGVLLSGHSPKYLKDSEVLDLSFSQDGLYFKPTQTGRMFFCGDLLVLPLSVECLLCRMGDLGKKRETRNKSITQLESYIG